MIQGTTDVDKLKRILPHYHANQPVSSTQLYEKVAHYLSPARSPIAG